MTAKKDDMKKVVDILKDGGIIPQDYTGKVTLHVSQGTISGIQLDTIIRPR